MTNLNLVPYEANKGGIGTPDKPWGKAFFKNLSVDNLEVNDSHNINIVPQGLQDNIDNLSTNISDISTQVNDINSQLSTIENDISSATTNINTILNTTIPSLDDRVGALEEAPTKIVFANGAELWIE